LWRPFSQHGFYRLVPSNATGATRSASFRLKRRSWHRQRGAPTLAPPLLIRSIHKADADYVIAVDGRSTCRLRTPRTFGTLQERQRRGLRVVFDREAGTVLQRTRTVAGSSQAGIFGGLGYLSSRATRIPRPARRPGNPEASPALPSGLTVPSLQDVDSQQACGSVMPCAGAILRSRHTAPVFADLEVVPFENSSLQTISTSSIRAST